MPYMGAEEICETVQMHIMLYIKSDIDGEHWVMDHKGIGQLKKTNVEHMNSHVSEMDRAGVVLKCWPSWSLNLS